MPSAIPAASGPADLDRAWLAALAGEPAFGLDRARGLRAGRAWPPARAGAALAHAVARNPGNLLAHVQRIRLWVGAKDARETHAALLDLFVALGPRGIELRQRMLDASGPLLSPHDAQFLAAALTPGLDASKPHPPAPGSMLSRGLTGTLSLVSRASEAAAFVGDALQEADDYIAEGNVAAAQSVLETALAAEPSRLDLARVLLDLYRRARDVAALRAMRARLGAGLCDGALWSGIEAGMIGPNGGGR